MAAASTHSKGHTKCNWSQHASRKAVPTGGETAHTHTHALHRHTRTPGAQAARGTGTQEAEEGLESVLVLGRSDFPTSDLTADMKALRSKAVPPREENAGIIIVFLPGNRQAPRVQQRLAEMRGDRQTSQP